MKAGPDGGHIWGLPRRGLMRSTLKEENRIRTKVGSRAFQTEAAVRAKALWPEGAWLFPGAIRSVPEWLYPRRGQRDVRTAPRLWEDTSLYPKALEGLERHQHSHFVKVPMAPLRGLTHLEQEQNCKGSGRENSCWHGSGHPLQTPAGPVPAVQVHAYPHHICSCTVEDGLPNITFWILGRGAQVDMFLYVG